MQMKYYHSFTSRRLGIVPVSLALISSFPSKDTCVNNVSILRVLSAGKGKHTQ